MDIFEKGVDMDRIKEIYTLWCDCWSFLKEHLCDYKSQADWDALMQDARDWSTEHGNNPKSAFMAAFMVDFIEREVKGDFKIK